MPEPAHDARRNIPGTDALLAMPEARGVGQQVAKRLIHAVQAQARSGEISPSEVKAKVQSLLAGKRGSLNQVINATGVVVHTNLGRAPLSAHARTALAAAAGYTDLEFDLASGVRSRRGAGATAALKAACPAAEDALIVNNGAAALMLATRALARQSNGVLLSRGEFIEIGAGFRLADLIASTGVPVKEVGTANRTHLADYDVPGTVLQVHRSNFRLEGFTSQPSYSELADLAHARGDALIVDVGSGLLYPDHMLPDEPAIATALEAGADIVIASGDKLLGGPQAGLILGRADAVAQLARNPLARAVRADKLTLAALEATLERPTPVAQFLHAPAESLHQRTQALRERIVEVVTDRTASTEALTADLAIVPHEGRVGGGGGAGVQLDGWALVLPQSLAAALRAGEPPVVGHVKDGRCLLDLRCVFEADDALVGQAIIAALEGSSKL